MVSLLFIPWREGSEGGAAGATGATAAGTGAAGGGGARKHLLRRVDEVEDLEGLRLQLLQLVTQSVDVADLHRWPFLVSRRRSWCWSSCCWNSWSSSSWWMWCCPTSPRGPPRGRGPRRSPTPGVPVPPGVRTARWFCASALPSPLLVVRRTWRPGGAGTADDHEHADGVLHSPGSGIARRPKLTSPPW